MLEKDNNHWIIAELQLNKPNSFTIQTLSTSYQSIYIEELVNAVRLLLSDIHSKLEDNDADLDFHIMHFNLMRTSVHWPQTTMELKGAFPKHVDTYALFLLRDWVLDESSPLGIENGDNLVMYLVFCLIYRTCSYAPQLLTSGDI